MRLEIVNPAEWIPRITHLLEQQWAEVGFDFPFAPDVGAYQRLFDAGMCFAVRAYDASGEMVGYCTVVVAPHPHNPLIVIASNDALFVAPEHRGGTLAKKIMQASEDEAKRRGAVRFTWHCRAGTSLARMLAKHGYTPADEVVMKEL